MDDKVWVLTGETQVQGRLSDDQDGTAFENCELVLEMSIAEERMDQLHERVCGQCRVTWFGVLRVLACVIRGIGSHLIAEMSSLAISAFDSPILIDRHKGLSGQRHQPSFWKDHQKR